MMQSLSWNRDFRIIAVFTVSLTLEGTSVGESSFPSHCAATETTVFSCRLRSSDKYISLCGSRPLRASDARLVYRFGVLGRVEFAYPSQTAGSLKKFRTAHYFRAQVDRRNVTFTNSNLNYEIFTDFEGERSRPSREGGITITTTGRKNVPQALYCVTPYLDRLELLDGVVLKGHDYLDDDE